MILKKMIDYLGVTIVSLYCLFSLLYSFISFFSNFAYLYVLHYNMRCFGVFLLGMLLICSNYIMIIAIMNSTNNLKKVRSFSCDYLRLPFKQNIIDYYYASKYCVFFVHFL